MSGNWASDIASYYIFNEERTRQSGKTSALAKACKDIRGVFITTTADLAREYRHKFKMQCLPLGSRLLGNNRPIIFDHYALQQLFGELIHNDVRCGKRENSFEIKLRLCSTLNAIKYKKCNKKRWRLRK